jgi:hypothetical protein
MFKPLCNGENEMKTCELTGAALDWAVAKCEGIGLGPRGSVVYYHDGGPAMWQPSTDWAQGGPIIEREGLALHRVAPGEWYAFMWWDDTDGAGDIMRKGPTPLIAAMRCYVASKLGDTVDLPKELL